MKLDPRAMPFPATWDASCYGVLYLAAGWDEDLVQADILMGTARAGFSLWPVDAGGKRARGGVQKVLRGAGREDLAKTAAAAGKSDTPAGHSDLVGCLAPWGRAVFLEVKRPARIIRGKVDRPAGVPDQDQLAFLLARHREGALVGVVWSLGDALAILRTVQPPKSTVGANKP